LVLEGLLELPNKLRLKWLVKKGLKLGVNCYIVRSAIIDGSYPWLMTIGNNCFLGAGAIILPNVHIGNNTIIGAGSVVTRDIPENSVAVGNPARRVCHIRDFIDSHSRAILAGPCFPKEGWTEGHGLTKERKQMIKDSVRGKVGYTD
jgi:maltose O-acetyltransferase